MNGIVNTSGSVPPASAAVNVGAVQLYSSGSTLIQGYFASNSLICRLRASTASWVAPGRRTPTVIDDRLVRGRRATRWPHWAPRWPPAACWPPAMRGVGGAAARGDDQGDDDGDGRHGATASVGSWTASSVLLSLLPTRGVLLHPPMSRRSCPPRALTASSIVVRQPPRWAPPRRRRSGRSQTVASGGRWSSATSALASRTPRWGGSGSDAPDRLVRFRRSRAAGEREDVSGGDEPPGQRSVAEIGLRRGGSAGRRGTGRAWSPGRPPRPRRSARPNAPAGSATARPVDRAG